MRGAIELPDVHDVVLVFEDSGLVVVYVQVVGGRKDRHHRWETCRGRLLVHAVSWEFGENTSKSWIVDRQ